MALVIDTQAPDFELANQFGEHVRLSDFRGRKPVALVFFPLAFSSTCTSELCELRDNIALFEQEGVELAGLQPDRLDAAVASREDPDGSRVVRGVRHPRAGDRARGEPARRLSLL